VRFAIDSLQKNAQYTMLNAQRAANILDPPPV